MYLQHKFVSNVDQSTVGAKIRGRQQRGNHVTVVEVLTRMRSDRPAVVDARQKRVEHVLLLVNVMIVAVRAQEGRQLHICV